MRRELRGRPPSAWRMRSSPGGTREQMSRSPHHVLSTISMLVPPTLRPFRKMKLCVYEAIKRRRPSPLASWRAEPSRKPVQW